MAGEEIFYFDGPDALVSAFAGNIPKNLKLLEGKILPYLRPLYDTLYEMFDFDEVNSLIEKSINAYSEDSASTRSRKRK